jgi:hypothetical protein
MRIRVSCTCGRVGYAVVTDWREARDLCRAHERDYHDAIDAVYRPLATWSEIPAEACSLWDRGDQVMEGIQDASMRRLVRHGRGRP